MDKRRPVKSCQELGSIPSAPANRLIHEVLRFELDS